MLSTLFLSDGCGPNSKIVQGSLEAKGTRRWGSFGCNFPVWEKVDMYREFHVCSSSIMAPLEQPAPWNPDGQGIRSVEAVLMWPLRLCRQPGKLQGPLLGQESNYGKQRLPLKRGDDLMAEAGNTRDLEGSAHTGVRMGRC